MRSRGMLATFTLSWDRLTLIRVSGMPLRSAYMRTGIKAQAPRPAVTNAPDAGPPSSPPALPGSRLIGRRNYAGASFCRPRDA